MTRFDTKRYCAQDATAVLIHPLDIMTLIYQRRSGMTHIVADPIPQILEAMGSDTLSVHEIARRIIAAFDVDPGADVIALLSERLDELTALGLVEMSGAA